MAYPDFLYRRIRKKNARKSRGKMHFLLRFLRAFFCAFCGKKSGHALGSSTPAVFKALNSF